MTWLVDRAVEGRWNWLRLPEHRPGLGDVVDYLADQVATGTVLLHGSNARTIECFEPHDQTSYRGAPIRAVFASPDPVWSLFFAVTDTMSVGSRWNACVRPERTGARRTRYFFSVGAADDHFWTDGAVYLLPRACFRASDEPSEWVATEPVRPLGVVPVTPADFPFRSRVFRHGQGEPDWRLEVRLVLDSVRAAIRQARGRPKSD